MTPTLPEALARVGRLRDSLRDWEITRPDAKADAAALTRVLAEVQRLRPVAPDPLTSFRVIVSDMVPRGTIYIAPNQEDDLEAALIRFQEATR